jgi:hypothetical protein
MMSEEGFMRSLAVFVLLVVGGVLPVLVSKAEDPVFSGPQVGEPLLAFQVRGVLGEDAGKDIDFVTSAKGKPVVLVFVHDVNRQSVSMTRLLTAYAAKRAKDGLTTGVVFLNADATEAENTVKRIKHALTIDVKNTISPEGIEGPGSYGLNRKVMMTVLVGNHDKVTANFALIQPSLQVDLPKIVEAIVKEVGGANPSLDELLASDPSMREMAVRGSAANKDAPEIRSLVRPLIQRDASDEDVDKAAKEIEIKMSEFPAIRKEIGRISNTIVDSGKIANYGTARAQEYLQRWAKEIGRDSPDDKSPPGKDPADKESTGTDKKEDKPKR